MQLFLRQFIVKIPILQASKESHVVTAVPSPNRNMHTMTRALSDDSSGQKRSISVLDQVDAILSYCFISVFSSFNMLYCVLPQAPFL